MELVAKRDKLLSTAYYGLDVETKIRGDRIELKANASLIGWWSVTPSPPGTAWSQVDVANLKHGRYKIIDLISGELLGMLDTSQKIGEQLF
jgi:hypothetical protein